jgi:hypothetical protein
LGTEGHNENSVKIQRQVERQEVRDGEREIQGRGKAVVIVDITMTTATREGQAKVLAGLSQRAGSVWSPARIAGPPARPTASAGVPPRIEQVEDKQEDCRADDGGQPGGEVEEPVQGVDVEQLRGGPAAAQRPGYPDQAGEDEAL